MELALKWFLYQLRSEFLTRNDIVIGDAQNTGILAVIVASEEIILVVPGKHGVGAQVVLVPTHVDTCRKVRIVESRRCDRPRGEIALAVIRHKLCARWKDDLIRS